MVYRLNRMEQEVMEFCTPVSPARLRKLLRVQRKAKKLLCGTCLAASWACIGVSLMVFAYILLG